MITDFKMPSLDETWVISRRRKDYYLTHDLHPWFAAFPPEIPKKLIQRYSAENEIVLDPFCGGGSTLVESMLLKRRGIGVDINPLACLISKVKTTPLEIDKKLVDKFLLSIATDINFLVRGQRQFSGLVKPLLSMEELEFPWVTSIDYWFRKDIQLSLAIILAHIKKEQNDDLRDFYTVAFSWILRKVSNATNLECHPVYKKGKEIPDPFLLFATYLKRMCDLMNEFSKKVKGNYPAKIYCCDSKRLSNILEEESVDLIVTSPPYGTGSDYTQIYRFSFEWLELPETHKREALEKSSDFCADLRICLKEMKHVLRKGKHCCIVIGNPSKHQEIVQSVVGDAVDIGFKLTYSIACPMDTGKTKCEKYYRFIPRELILILQKNI